ncbi:TolB family protein [Deinococcus sp.]|uniref:TolB family protein n=1 Tax=Deinococcus sp. TaxID=47478 RepID=UPI003C7B1DF0
MKQRTWRAALFLGACLTGGPGTLAAGSAAPPAGAYSCLVLSPEFDPDLGMTMRYRRPNRSLGSVVLDGKGSYRLQGGAQAGSGAYSFDAAKATVRFSSGPMSRYPVRYSVDVRQDSGAALRVYTLQFLDPKTGKDSAFWCEQEAKSSGSSGAGGTTTANAVPGAPAAPAAASAKAGSVNPGVKGTLLYSSNQTILSFDLTTGRSVGRLSGRDVSVSANGSVAYLNTQDQVAFASSSYQPQKVLPQLESDSDVSQLALSPDGGRVAYTTGDSYHPGVTVRDRSGQVLANLDGRAAPAWTPDGRLLVTARDGEPAGLWISTPDLKSWQAIPLKVDNLTAAQLSPDGKRLAFVSNGWVWLANPDGSAAKRLGSADNNAFDPVWSPDGRALIFNANSGRLYSLTLDGQVRPLLTDKGDAVVVSYSYAWR